MDPLFRTFIGDNALSIDQINITPLDDCHQPQGIIARAQQYAAEAFHAEQTFFSVQGTSTLIMTMIMAVCGPGDKIILPRNVHKSVMAGLILAGAAPVFVVPEMDEDSGFVGSVAPGTIERALNEHRDARALFMINPSYYGACADMRAIVELAHAYDVPVLVDEAHGAQFYFHEQFPPTAMQAGADAAAVSMHKTGGSLTQSSLLNVQGARVCPRRVQSVLNLLTTTSTSYLLLASLDAARRHMQKHGRTLLDRALTVADDARRRINTIPGLHCNGPDGPGERLAHAWDRTKLCIDVRGLGLTGRQVETLLRRRYNIEVELSDLHNVLCLITIADDGEGVTRLVDALQAIATEHYVRSAVYPGPPKAAAEQRTNFPQPVPVHSLALTPREAFYAAKESLPLEETCGRISAEFITAYPPGIPTLVPGEVITASAIAAVRRYQTLDYPIHGPEDATVQTLQVVANR